MAERVGCRARARWTAWCAHVWARAWIAWPSRRAATKPPDATGPTRRRARRLATGRRQTCAAGPPPRALGELAEHGREPRQELGERARTTPEHRDLGGAAPVSLKRISVTSGEGGTGGCTASSGSSVTPTPAATIWRSVSRLVARKPTRSVAPESWHTASGLVAQAVALVQQQHALARQHRRGRRAHRAGQRVPCGHGQHEVLREQELLVQLVVVDRAAPAPRRRACRRAGAWQHGLGLPSTRSSSRLGNRWRTCGTTWAAGTAPASGRDRCARVPASGSTALRAMPRMLSASREDQRARSATRCTRARSGRSRRGLRSISSHAQLALELLELGGQRRLAARSRPRPPDRSAGARPTATR